MGKLCLGDIQISGIRLYSGPINTSDATVVAQMLPQGAIAYGSDGKVVGTGQHYIRDGEVGIILADNAEKHSGTYYAVFSITLPSGYYDGTTKVILTPIENLSPAILPVGTSVLGIEGTARISAGVEEATNADGTKDLYINVMEA